MKKQFTPIAMKCNKEQFEAIKPKLKGIVINSVNRFNDYPYLINTDGDSDTINNITKNGFGHLWRRFENIHETWNERIFLEACGIEKEEAFEITKETIIKYKMKDEFPEVFKVKLEVGKWYKRPHNKALFFIVGDPKITPFEVYGFDMEGNWMNVEKARTFPDYEIEATKQEVFEALKNEAVMRGFKEGVCIDKLLNYNQGTHKAGFFKTQVSDESFSFDIMCNYLFIGNLMIFRDGTWAKIIPTKTKEEVEKLLGVKIID